MGSTEYLNELTAWAKKRAKDKKRPSLDAAAVSFLAAKSDVVTAMEAGFSLTTIWEHMKETGRIASSYETFRKHVRKYVKKSTRTSVDRAQNSLPADQGQPGNESASSKADQVSGNDTPPDSSKPESTMKGFQYKPTAAKEDLI